MGHVENFSEKFAAEKAARRVNNVKAVAEEIEVRLPSSAKHATKKLLPGYRPTEMGLLCSKRAVKVKVEKVGSL